MSTFAHPEQRVFFWAASLLRVAAPSYRKIRQANVDEPRTNKARNGRASMQLITTAHTVRLVILPGIECDTASAHGFYSRTHGGKRQSCENARFT